MSMTDQRKTELVSLYDELKQDVLDIEQKYSLTFHKIDLKFPDSLGLPKMQYVAPDDEAIVSLAEQEVAPKYLEKQRNAEKSFESKKATAEKQLAQLAESNRQKLAALASQYAQTLKELFHKLTDNGLFVSSVRIDAEREAELDYQRDVQEQTLSYDAEKTAFDEQNEAVQKAHESNLAALENQRMAEIAVAVQDLKQKEANKKKEVEKYNASVDEKETKYVASCKRYAEYAQQAENERALAAARLYAELGESGVELQKKSEMLNRCKTVMWSLTKEEGQFVLSLDSFLMSHLGDYYSSLQDWVNTQLPS